MRTNHNPQSESIPIPIDPTTRPPTPTPTPMGTGSRQIVNNYLQAAAKPRLSQTMYKCPNPRGRFSTPCPRKPPKQRAYMQLPRVPFSLDFSGYPSIYKALSGCSQIEPKREPRVNRGRARRCNRGRRLLERHWLWPGRRGRSVDPRVRRPARTNRARLRGECRPPRQLRHPCKQGYPGSNLSIRDFVLGHREGRWEGGIQSPIEVTIAIGFEIAIEIEIEIEYRDPVRNRNQVLTRVIGIGNHRRCPID
jgi:hypothetical protein